MKPSEIPIRSTWRDAIGVKLTNRRITNRIKQGWYGRIEQLKLLARSTDKEKRNKAKAELVKYEGQPIKARRVKAGQLIKNIEEFC